MSSINQSILILTLDTFSNFSIALIISKYFFFFYNIVNLYNLKKFVFKRALLDTSACK